MRDSAYAVFRIVRSKVQAAIRVNRNHTPTQRECDSLSSSSRRSPDCGVPITSDWMSATNYDICGVEFLSLSTEEGYVMSDLLGWSIPITGNTIDAEANSTFAHQFCGKHTIAGRIVPIARNRCSVCCRSTPAKIAIDKNTQIVYA